MHDLSDLIIECVTNSREAGADDISIRLEKDGSTVKVRISDNGNILDVEHPFDKGYSTKGSGRGNGLYYLKARAQDASIFRQEDRTIVEFSIEKDDSIEKLEDLLFPLFQGDEKIEFSYIENGKSVLEINSADLEEVPYTAKAIAKFKAVVRDRIRRI